MEREGEGGETYQPGGGSQTLESSQRIQARKCSTGSYQCTPHRQPETIPITAKKIQSKYKLWVDSVYIFFLFLTYAIVVACLVWNSRFSSIGVDSSVESTLTRSSISARDHVLDRQIGVRERSSLLDVPPENPPKKSPITV